MNRSDDWFPLVPTGSRNQTEPVGASTVTGAPPVPAPDDVPVGEITGGNQSPATEPRWTPPTPATAPRLWPAWQTLLEHLADGKWHPRQETIEHMTSNSDIQTKTASNLIASGARYGLIQRRKHRTQYEDRLSTYGITHPDPSEPAS